MYSMFLCASNNDLCPSHTLQMRCMRNDGVAHPAVFNIFYAVLLAGLFNDLADGRVVDV